MFVSLRRTQTWRLHTKLYKFRWHTSANSARMKNRSNLILGEVVYISIIYRIPDSWLFHWMVTIFSFDYMTGENREFCEMLRAVARLQCVLISEIIAGDIALYTTRVLLVWSTLVSFEWCDRKIRARIHGAILCSMLRAMDKLRRVSTPEIFACDISHNIACILHAWFTLVAFEWLHSKLRARIHGAILCAMFGIKHTTGDFWNVRRATFETYDGQLLDQRLNLRFDWLNIKVCVTGLHEMLQLVDTRDKFVGGNVAEVGRNSTAAILREMFRATNSGVDKRCNLATVRNATPCIQALSLIEYQITICTWSWTSNKIFFQENHVNCWGHLEFNFRMPRLLKCLLSQ